MEDPVLVQVECPLEELLHIELDLTHLQPNRGIFKHTVQIVVHIRFHHVHVAEFSSFATGAVGHVDHRDNAWMAKLFEKLDFPKSGDGETVFRIVNRHFFERDCCPT